MGIAFTFKTMLLLLSNIVKGKDQVIYYCHRLKTKYIVIGKDQITYYEVSVVSILLIY